MSAQLGNKNLVAFRRLNKKGQYLTVLLNFSGCDQTVTIPVDKGIRLESVFDTGTLSDGQKSVNIEKAGEGYVATLTIPAFSGAIYKRITANKKINI